MRSMAFKRGRGIHTRRVGVCVGREGLGQQLARKLEYCASIIHAKSGCYVWRTKQEHAASATWQ